MKKFLLALLVSICTASCSDLTVATPVVETRPTTHVIYTTISRPYPRVYHYTTPYTYYRYTPRPIRPVPHIDHHRPQPTPRDHGGRGGRR